MRILKQSTSTTIKLGPFMSTDGITAATGLSIGIVDVRLSKNGGDFAEKNDAGSTTHDEFGYYNVTLDSQDTNTLNNLIVAINHTGALPLWSDFTVVSNDAYSLLISGDNENISTINDRVTTALPNALPGSAGGLFRAGTNTSTMISGDTYGLQIVSTGATSNAVDISSPWQGIFVDANLGAVHLYSAGGYGLRANGAGGDLYLENSTVNVGPFLQSISSDITLASGGLNTTILATSGGGAGDLTTIETYVTDLSGTTYTILTGVQDIQDEMIRKGATLAWVTSNGSINTTIG